MTGLQVVLGIDTATVVCAGLAVDGVLVASGQVADRMAHVEQLTPLIRRICREARIVSAELTDVVAELRPVLKDSAATRAQRLRALELTALSQLILGDEAAARGAFERLLDIDPDYQLRDDSGSPRIRRFFDELKRELFPGFDADLVAELDHAAPPEASAGRRLEIDVRALDGGEHVKEVVMLVRRRGDQEKPDTEHERREVDQEHRQQQEEPPEHSG